MVGASQQCSTKYDVLIVGAGPAGAATALRLARHGYGVCVVDRARFPRDKVCGEGLMPHGLDELAELGVLERVQREGVCFDGVAYQVGDVRAAACFPGGRRGLGVRRTVLDLVLVEAMKGAGVVLREGLQVQRLEVDDAGVTLWCSEGERLQGRVLIGADGLHSRVRQQLGLEVSLRTRPRYGGSVHFRLASGHLTPSKVEVTFVGNAELYVTPVRPGVINIAVLCDKATAGTLSGDLDGGMRSIIERSPLVGRYLEGSECVRAPRFCGPLRQEARSVVADRALLVGDAAGFLDPVTGEGCSIALKTARWATEVLHPALTADTLAAADLSAYEARRAVGVADLIRLTKLVLWWAGKPALHRYVVKNLRRNPKSFQRMLGVVAGQGGLSDLSWSELRKVSLGA